MKEELYQRIKNAFIVVRNYYGASENVDRNRLDAAFGELRYARKNIDKNAPAREKQLLLYCIDTLFALVSEDNRQKTYDFADAVHNVPEIFIGKRKFSSFSREFNVFCEKYGYEYFSDYNKFLLKNIPLYLLPLTQKVDKASVAKTTPWLIASICICLLLPMAIYGVSMFLLDAPNSGWLLLGMAGSFVLGVGLCNIVASLFGEYLGHLLTVICLTSGVGMTAASLFLLFHPTGKNILSEEAVTYLVFSFMFLVVCAFFYWMFRRTVAEWLKIKKELNMTQQKKLKKGVFNFLWYLAIQKEVGLGWLFFLNLVFTLAFTGAFAFSFLTLVFHGLAAVNSLFLTVTYISIAVMYMFYRVRENLKNHKTPIVLFRENPEYNIYWRRKIYDSIFLDLFFMGFIAVFLYAVLKGGAQLCGFSLIQLLSSVFS